MLKPKKKKVTKENKNKQYIVGNQNELTVFNILKKADIEVSATFGSGSVFGDQDLLIKTEYTNYRLSLKSKTQTKTGKFPSLSYQEVLEPILYVERNLKLGEVPTTIVSWYPSEDSPKHFVLIPLDDFTDLIKSLNNELRYNE